MSSVYTYININLDTIIYKLYRLSSSITYKYIYIKNSPWGTEHYIHIYRQLNTYIQAVKYIYTGSYRLYQYDRQTRMTNPLLRISYSR